jgi:hypothetical protein
MTTPLSHPLTILPSVLLHAEWFAVLTAFVALNTIMYVALAVGKVLPRVYLSDWIHAPNRRSQTRSIYPQNRVDVPQAVIDPRDELLDRVG